MKVRPSVKKMCEKCKIIKRKGKVMVINGGATDKWRVFQVLTCLERKESRSL